LASGTPIPEAFVPPVLGIGASEHVHEVGSVEGFAESDCVLLPKVAMLLAVDHGAADPIWFKSHPCEQVTRVVLMMACGGIRSEHPETADQSLGLLQPPLRAAADWLTGEPSEVQADLVIVAGDGTLGGPPCGLIVGRSDLIDSIARSSIGRTVAANVAITAMMTHALEAFSGGDPTLHPVRAMLQTGEGNLRSRAERLATRLSGDESIRNCQIAAEPALLSPTGPWRIASRQLRLQHHSKSAQSWADQLLHGVPAVLAGVSDDALIIDLRWVPPCDDGALCATILGQTLSNSSEQGATEPNQTNDLRP
jgi:L-seryl-tRNA(Ser) seleniumtransferase